MSSVRTVTYHPGCSGWRAKPLVSYKVIVDLISSTTTKTGLKVHCELDTRARPYRSNGII